MPLVIYGLGECTMDIMPLAVTLMAKTALPWLSLAVTGGKFCY